MQKLGAAGLARDQADAELKASKTFVLVVEHDLAVLDYLSDYICCLYGTPSAYGVVTMPFSVREGINIFLAGFIPTENLRFREEALTFKVSERADTEQGGDRMQTYKYPSMTKQMGVKGKEAEGDQGFLLHIEVRAAAAAAAAPTRALSARDARPRSRSRAPRI